MTDIKKGIKEVIFSDDEILNHAALLEKLTNHITDVCILHYITKGKHHP